MPEWSPHVGLLSLIMMDSMAACFCCLRCRTFGAGISGGHVILKEQPAVKLDTAHMGKSFTNN